MREFYVFSQAPTSLPASFFFSFRTFLFFIANLNRGGHHESKASFDLQDYSNRTRTQRNKSYLQR